MPVFGLAALILAILAITRSLGCRHDGLLANMALWFALGVFAIPLLMALSCFFSP